jgi:ubiquinone/menaquinone biosynthesis C-methylase UbiE
MSREMRSVRRNWERFGQTDPMWGVLTHPGMEGRWDPESFYEHGRRDVQSLYKQLGQAGVKVPAGRALDFGCGAGRLSFALASRFDSVDGVDISEAMLEFANSHRPPGDNCEFSLYDGRRLEFPDGCFDFAVSLTTLQHVPPAAVPSYVREMFRVLRFGGVLAVQIPTPPPPSTTPVPIRARLRRRASTLAYRYLAHRPVMRMSGIDPDEVKRMILEAGGDAPQAILDGRAGDWAPSYLYVSRKQQLPS